MISKAVSLCLVAFHFAFFLSAQHGGYRFVGLDNAPQIVYSSKINSEIRIPYSSSGLWGFLNQKGEVVVDAKYPKVQNFSENLAAVRAPEGLYGYIDIKGNMVIKPNFDDAFRFKSGVAIGFTGERPILIHKNGKTYKLPEYVNHINNTAIPGHFIVETKSGNQGLIDYEGHFVVDTIYSSISSFNEGYAIVRAKKENSESGLINEKGKQVVPLGKYIIKENYSNGAFQIQIPDSQSNVWSASYAMVSLDGDTLMQDKKSEYEIKYGHERKYDDGLFLVDIFRPENFLDKDDPEYDNWIKDLGLVNSDGEFLWKNDEWDDITGYQNKRAFGQEKESTRWFLINEKGEKLNKRGYIEINAKMYGNDYALFEEGFEPVLTDEGWTLIDREANSINQPLFRVVDQALWMGNFLLYGIENEDEQYQYGFWDAEKNKDTGPQYDDISWIDQDTQTFMVEKNNEKLVKNMDGETLWKQPIDESPGPLNVDFMVRGYFYASSPPKRKYAGFGGWGGSSNQYKSASSVKSPSGHKLLVIVEDEPDTTFAGIYRGYRVKVLNLRKDTVVLEAQDSRLYMNVQAKNKAGEWKDIEYLPSSWCGNSYHQLYLPPGTEWAFATPQYKGGFETELRIKLTYNGKGETESCVYSNTYQGSVNPGQFWQKPVYTPGGIMDPYYD